MNNIEMEKIVKSTFGGLLYEIRSEYEISQEVWLRYAESPAGSMQI